MSKEVIIDDLLDVMVRFYGKAVVDGQEIYVSINLVIKRFNNEVLKKLGMNALTNTFNRMSSNVQNIQMITKAEYLENTEED